MLSERLTAVGYVIIVISASFGVQRATLLYDFACPSKPTGQRTLSVAEAEAEAKREVGENCEEV